MKVVAFAQAQTSLGDVLDAVVNDAEAAIITRQDAQSAVVMSLDSYNCLMETMHLMRSKANADHLARSITQYRAGEAAHRELIDAE